MIERIETNLEEQSPDQPVGPEQGELVVRRWRGLERRLGRELFKTKQIKHRSIFKFIDIFHEFSPSA